MAEDDRTELVVVAGGTTGAAAREVERLVQRLCALRPGTAVLHHDLRDVARGVVHRRLRLGGTDETVPVELRHGCVSCAADPDGREHADPCEQTTPEPHIPHDRTEEQR